VAKPRVRILIADDQRLFAEGLRVVIESRAPEFQIVGIAGSGKEACAMVREHPPDIVLMDVRMPEMDGVEATRLIHERHPEVKILILTTFEDDEYVTYSMQNGAVGYLLKNRRPEELIDSIRMLHRGIVQIDSAVSGRLLSSPREDHASAEEFISNLRTLTVREREILRGLVNAKRIVQIADGLQIAEQTVRNHVSNIYTKLHIHNRVEIVQYIGQIRYFLDHLV
jgi:DNA-binding NarL/FixJ family response regulator